MEKLDTKEVKRINKGLAELTDKHATLQDFLEKAPELHPLVASALEGIYCGVCDSKDPAACARSIQQLGETNRYITFGWYIDPGTHARTGLPPKVEYAYVS